MITQRRHPTLGNEIICTEPSPDVAKALAAAAALTAQGGDGAASGTLGFNGSSAEAAIELAGRSTALLALRDALFRACEAYANGIIGQDAYSLVLSRYGQVMTTLFLGQDVTSAAGAEGKAAAINAVLQSGGGGGGGGSTTTETTTKTPAAPPVKAPGQSSDASQPGFMGRPTLAAYHPGMDAELPVSPAVITTPGGGSGGAPPVVLVQAGGAAPAAGGANAANNAGGNTTGGTTGNAAQPQSASAAGVSTAAALTLGRMNEDYFHLDSNLLHLLVVSCINEFDVTRYRKPTTPPPTDQEKKNQSTQQRKPASPATFGKGAMPKNTPESNNLTLAEGGNPFLLAVCNQMTYAEIVKAEETAAKTPPSLINPEVAAVQLTATNAKAGTNAPAAPAKPDPNIKEVQSLLKQVKCAGCDPGVVDGLKGPATTKAVSAYQKLAVKSCPTIQQNGDPLDAGTVACLKSKGYTPAPDPEHVQATSPLGSHDNRRPG